MSLPTWDALPSFELYKDQIVSVVNDATASFGDSLSSSMINNYVKQKLIDPPIKKKYNRTHVAQLIFINLMKGIFPINEILSFKNQFLMTSKMEDNYNKFIEIFNERLNHHVDGKEKNNRLEVLEELVEVLITKKQIKNLLQTIEED